MKKYRADILLLALFLLIGAVFAGFLLFNGRHGSSVQVRVNGVVTESFSLNENITYEIKTDGGHNTLVIENGRAWITVADCPDKLCEGMGKISRAGQSIVCLPRQVVVEIVGDSGIDAEAG